MVERYFKWVSFAISFTSLIFISSNEHNKIHQSNNKLIMFLHKYDRHNALYEGRVESPPWNHEWNKENVYTIQNFAVQLVGFTIVFLLYRPCPLDREPPQITFIDLIAHVRLISIVFRAFLVLQICSVVDVVPHEMLMLINHSINTTNARFS